MHSAARIPGYCIETISGVFLKDSNWQNTDYTVTFKHMLGM